ncbi:hypothetical protein V8D89_001631 [Ganoderma adspersum]
MVDTVFGETHTVHFESYCGYGVTLLIQGTTVLSTGHDYTSTGPLTAIAYLQTDAKCGFNGENCTLLQTTLANPALGNSGSLTNISLTSSQAFSVSTGFYYIDGCSCCTGANCGSSDCAPPTAPLSGSCHADNVDLAITFCAPTST